jgi:hypothetical protein
MTVKRKTLYVGVFLLTAGAVLLAGQTGALDTARVAEALRLWPLVVIVAGLALILRRTRLGLAGGIAAAVAPGLLFGGMAVAAPNLGHICTGGQDAAATAVRDGELADGATVDLSLACGELRVDAVSGTRWSLDTRGRAGGEPRVVAGLDRLEIGSVDRVAGWRPDEAGSAWDVHLPAGRKLDLRAEVNAGSGRLDLAGAQLGSLNLALNAGELRLDLTGATATDLRLEVNAGDASVRLPAASDLAARIDVNAGAVEICAPDGLGLRLDGGVDGIGSIDHTGLVSVGDAWQTPGYDTAPYHAVVTVTTSVGSVDINPKGGCK